MYRKTIVAVAVTLGLSAPGLAQHANEGDSPTMLAPVLVTDGLTSVEQDKSGRAFTVITGEELEKRQIRYVADALRHVPGFAVSRMGSYGNLTQVRVRGSEGNHILVMIDGVDVSETSTGEFDFGSLIVDNIERIEVLRGPQSTFWGSNALAGVVNIITKKGQRNGWSARANAETGTDRTQFGGLALSGGGKKYDLALSGTFRRSDGFNASHFGSEKDGDRNATLNGRLNIDLTPSLAFDSSLRFVDRRSDVDPQDFGAAGPTYGFAIDGDHKTATREIFGSFGLTHKSFGGALTQRARFTGSDTFRENHENNARVSWNDGNRYNGMYRASYAFSTPGLLNARHQLTGGFEQERETFRPSHLDNAFSRHSRSLIGEYRGEFADQFYVNIGMRHDFNDRFADASTYSVAGAWRIPGAGARVHASVGTGVTNPTFYEQFGYIPNTFVGNPDLMPEKSLGWDVGIEKIFLDSRLVADVTYFNQNLTREIATVFDANFISTPVNRDGMSKREGVELAATLDLFSGFTANASYTYLRATEQTVSDGPRLREVRRPKHSGSLGVVYTFRDKRAHVFADLVFNGTMVDNTYVPTLPPRITLPSYRIVNFGGGYRFSDKVEIYARIENLFDEDYEEVFGFNTPGRMAFVGLRGTF